MTNIFGAQAFDVLECHRCISNINTVNIPRVVKDYEFDYYLTDELALFVDDVKYEVAGGTAAFRKPGEKVCSMGYYDCYSVTFNFSQTNGPVGDAYMRNHTGGLQSDANCEFIKLLKPYFITAEKQAYITILQNLSSISYPHIISTELQRYYAQAFLLKLLSDTISASLPKLDTVRSEIQKVCYFMDVNFREPINIQQLAGLVHFTPNYLITLFREETKKTPMEYLLGVRMNEARFLMKNTELKISNIALMCGFNSSSYFIEAFKKMYGATPAKYRGW